MLAPEARATKSPDWAQQSFHGTPLPRATVGSPGTSRPCLDGQVVNASTGAPVGAAQVVFATKEGALLAQTKSDGRFSVNASEGQVTLAEVSADGFFPFRPDWGHSPVELTLTPGACVSDLVLALLPRVRYRGQVLAPGGEGVGGAAVTIAEEHEAPLAPITTAPDGSFDFFARTGAIVEASHPAFTQAAALVDFRVHLTKELVVTLGAKTGDAGVERVRLHGIVVDSHDAGVPGALVQARRSLTVEGNPTERVEAIVQSDDEGRFELTATGPPPWTMTAELAGAMSASTTTMGEPVTLRLLDGATLIGRVTDTRGRAVSSFSVLSRQRLGALRLGEESARHFVDGQGRFLIHGLTPGPLQVVVAAWGHAPSDPRDVVLVAGATQRLDVTLSSGAQVTGRVIDRDTRVPLPGARVSLEEQREDALAVSPLAPSDDEGRFSLSGLSHGRRSLFVTAEGHHARLSSIVIPEGDATVGPLTIELKAIAPGESPLVELVGVGAVLKVTDEGLRIDRVLASGGAAEAGLVAGDTILTIDGTPVERLGFESAIQSIRGAEDSFVRLSVRRADGSTLSLDVPRRQIRN